MVVLKVAVAGLGRIGWKSHLPKIAKHNIQFRLVAVVDMSQERLDEAKKVYGVNGYQDLEEMITAEKPDLVVIATPTHLHMEHACAAMRMGCDVILEKPMAADYASAKEIADCASEYGRKIMVYQPQRLTDVTNHLKAILSEGKLGKIFMVKLSRNGYERRNDWQSLAKFGGGMLNNYGAHCLDQLYYLFRENITKVSCILYKIASAGDAEDVVKILMETQNHIIYDVDICQAAALPMNTWMIFGEYGAVTLENNGSFTLRYYDPASIPAAVTSEELMATNRSYFNDVPIPWKTEIIPVDPGYAIDFYDKCYEYFGEGKDPFIPLEDTLYTMDTIRRCREASNR